MDWLKATFVFFAYVILDWLYANYTIQIQKKNAVKAGLCGGLMYVLLAYGTIIYINEPKYIIFVGLGSFVGTWIAVRQQNK